MTNPLVGAAVLVTGGTGTFGYAFVAHALTTSVRRVVVFSRDELKQAQMAERFPDERLRFFLGDVRDPTRLALALEGIDTVIHAAAMKRIEACEADPLEAIATNVLGTQHVALAAVRARVTRAVLLSTDKAPAAHTLYGSTKFTAERLWLAANAYGAGRTRFAATRYGNVLGSRGSVVERWREQARVGAPLTVTDATHSRFWMTSHAAVAIVCLALDEMRGGEVFVPKCASALTLTLAEALIPGYPITMTGARPGERVAETLISADEAHTTHDAGTHYVIEPEARTWGTVPPLSLPLVPPGFSYRSDTNPDQWTASGLRACL